jgi:hypothetical protein
MAGILALWRCVSGWLWSCRSSSRGKWWLPQTRRSSGCTYLKQGKCLQSSQFNQAGGGGGSLQRWLMHTMDHVQPSGSTCTKSSGATVKSRRAGAAVGLILGVYGWLASVAWIGAMSPAAAKFRVQLFHWIYVGKIRGCWLRCHTLQPLTQNAYLLSTAPASLQHQLWKFTAAVGLS